MYSYLFFIWQINIIVYRTQNGYVNTILYLYLSIDENIIQRLCKYKGVEIIEGHIMPDHIHLLLSIPSKYSVSSITGYLKGKSSLMIFDTYFSTRIRFIS